jgi:hypothetical protein
MNEKGKTEILRRIFNEVDPVGINFGQNIDEYDPEIKELIALSPDYSNLEDIDKKLKDIFTRYFEGVQLNLDSLRKLAGKISTEFGKGNN